MDNSFLTPNLTFQHFSLEHGLTLLFWAVFGAALILWARRQPVEIQDKVGRQFTYFIAGSLVVWTGLKLFTGQFDITNDLPFHLCNLMGLLVVLLARSKKFWMYEVLFFWTMAGTVQALITPALKDSFPHYNYFKFWIVHAGVVVYILYATFVYGMRPTLKSVFKAYFALMVYAAVTFLINKLLDANYFFLNGKPPHPSALDVLGDWPVYIGVILVGLVPFFLLIYLPFAIFKQRD